MNPGAMYFPHSNFSVFCPFINNTTVYTILPSIGVPAGVRGGIIVGRCSYRCPDVRFFHHLPFPGVFTGYVFCVFHNKYGWGGEDEWNGPSSGAKRIQSLKKHLKEGGGVSDGIGLIARVVGEAGALPPRTGGECVTLDSTLYYLPSESDPLSAFEQAISTYKAVFISRPAEAHDTLHTASITRMCR